MLLVALNLIIELC